MAHPAAVLDIDGTLVDTNYHHSIAWFRALRDHGALVPLWRIHRHIGMGGDQIVPALVDDEFDERCGEQVRSAESELYADMIDEVEPLPGARDLIAELHERGHAIVLSSSAKEEEVEHYVELLDVGDLIDGYTTSADVDRTKPEPDLVEAALESVRRSSDGGESPAAVFIGDSVWDCKAARRAGLQMIGLLTGGFGAQELLDAGAAIVLENAERLRCELGKTPLTA